MSPDRRTSGNGLLLFFRVDDFDWAVKLARSLSPRFVEEQPRPGDREAGTAAFVHEMDPLDMFRSGG